MQANMGTVWKVPVYDSADKNKRKLQGYWNIGSMETSGSTTYSTTYCVTTGVLGMFAETSDMRIERSLDWNTIPKLTSAFSDLKTYVFDNGYTISLTDFEVIKDTSGTIVGAYCVTHYNNESGVEQFGGSVFTDEYYDSQKNGEFSYTAYDEITGISGFPKSRVYTKDNIATPSLSQFIVGTVEYDTKTLIDGYMPGISTWGLNDKGNAIASYIAAVVSTAKKVDTFPGPDSEETTDAEGGGGDGTFSDDTEPIDFPEVPSTSATNTGMIISYKMLPGQVDLLAKWMWTDDFITNFKKVFSNPIEAIVNLAIVYADPLVGESIPITIGNLTSNTSGAHIISQYKELDCGSVTLKKYWGNSLDYAPYTKISLYLPFIGMQVLDTDLVQGSTVHLKYIIDVLTGVCTAMLRVTKTGLDSVMYQYTGNCSQSIPITATNMTQVIQAAAGIATTAGVAVATGGLAAVSAAGAGAAAAGSAALGSLGASAIPATASIAGQVLGAKCHIQMTGRMDSGAGIIGVKKPYLVITHPVQSLPKNYNHYHGYTCNMTLALSSLSGFTVISNIYCDFAQATETEKTELKNLMLGGIIL